MSKSMLDRRNFLLAGAAAGTAGSAALAALHDGELGGPPQIIQGGMPWTEGLADAPPGAAGSGYSFFSGAEASAIEAIVDRLIPPDATGLAQLKLEFHSFSIASLLVFMGAATIISSAAPGPREHPNRAIRRASARPNIIAPHFRKSTNMHRTISRVRSLPSSRRVIRTVS